MRLNVATFNIQHGQNYPHFLKTGENLIDLSLTAEQIREMGSDICVLNEVRNETNVGGIDQAKEIAEKLGFHYRFAKAINIKSGGEYGNALVSRYPITDFYTCPIALSEDLRIDSPRYEERVLFVATVDADGIPLTVLGCHFGLSGAEHKRALQVILGALGNLTEPIILAGDFNVSPDNQIIKELSLHLEDTANKLTAPKATFIGTCAEDSSFGKKIDYIFVGGMKTLSSVIPNESCSDHRSMCAIVEI